MPDDAKPYLYLIVNGILRLHNITGIALNMLQAM